MKGIQIFIVMLMIPLGTVPTSADNDEMRIVQRHGNPQNHQHIRTQQFQFLHHCFGPLPQKATRVLKDLRRYAENDGGDFRVALLGRVRDFLLEEACAALQEIAADRGCQVDRAAVLPHAENFLRVKLEGPYREKNDGQCPYADPDLLARGTFTYFVGSHLRSSGSLARFVIEQGIRFD